MLKMNNKVAKKFAEAKNRLIDGYFTLESSKLFSSIKEGFLLLIPIFVVGAFVLAILNFPIDAVKNFFHTALDGTIYRIFRYIYEGTFGLASLYIVFAVSYKYAQKLSESDAQSRPILCAIAAVGSYLALLGISKEGLTMGTGFAFSHFNFTVSLGFGSVFSALFTAVLATRLFFLFCALFKKRKSKPNSIGTNANYFEAITSIFPTVLTMFIFALLSVLLILIFKKNNINEIIYSAIAAPFQHLETGYGSGILILLVQTVVWFFGIHGGNAFDQITKQLFPEQNGEILTKTFLDNFALFGGCGAVLCLLIAILLFSRSKTSKSVAKNSVFPMLFNISELFVFGLPVVFNLIYMIPFLLAPLVTFSVSYAGMSLGFAPIPGEATVGWTTPVIWSGVLATGSWRGAVLQLISIAAGVMVYAPFVKLNDKLNAIRNERAIGVLCDKIREAEAKNETPHLFQTADYTAVVAREIALKMRAAMKNKTIEMHYQPQIDASGRVVSCEALLRWRYTKSGYLFPPLVIAVAKEDNIYDELNEYIVDRVIEDTVRFNERFGEDFHASVNLQSIHFNNFQFVNRLVEKTKALGIIPGTLNVEITEQTELIDNDDTKSIFDLLKEHQIGVEIDDFSMGHTSLNYLQEHDFAFVKLDGGLVKTIVHNERIQGIVQSIASLGQKIGFQLIAEFVETEEQQKILQELGCFISQGWLYSPALPFDALIHYVQSMNRIADSKEASGSYGMRTTWNLSRFKSEVVEDGDPADKRA